MLGVNKNTVLRALHILRDEGLLEFRRRRGITVVGTPQRGAVLARTRELAEFARRHGFGRDEIVQIGVWGGSTQPLALVMILLP